MFELPVGPYSYGEVIAGVILGFGIGICIAMLFSSKLIIELTKALKEANDQVELLVAAIKDCEEKED